MWKKIALYTTFAVVAGLLVLGAVNRTLARNELVAGENGGGAGRGASRSVAEQGFGHGAGSGSENATGEVGQSAEAARQGRGENGGGNGQATRDGAAAASRNGGQNLQGGGGRGQSVEAAAQTYEWQQVTGEVTQMDDTQMTLRLADGTDLLVEGRPWQFAQQAGFQAQVGNQLQVRGYLEDGEFKVGALLNLAGDQEELELRNAAGQPGWRGQGAGRSGS